MSEDPQAVEQPEIPETPPEAEVAVEDYVPPGSELVVRDPTDEIEVFRVLDRHDEDMILRELQHLPERMLYDFPQGGQKVIDLSYAGVNECVRWMNSTGKVKIAVDPSVPPVIETVVEDLGEGPVDCWQVTVYARDAVTGYGQFGTFIQPKWTKLKPETAKRYERDGKTVDEAGRAPNPFARQVALGKAQRNALKLMIPEKIRAVLIAQKKGDPKAVKEIRAGAGAEGVAELPPPLQDEKADALRAEIRGLHEELRKLDPIKVTPAAFHAYMTRAEHSHERLEEFRGYMEQRLAEAKAAA
jgi:hypothetical protein